MAAREMGGDGTWPHDYFMTRAVLRHTEAVMPIVTLELHAFFTPDDADDADGADEAGGAATAVGDDAAAACGARARARARRRALTERHACS